jgi:uncharacterized protein (TIGR02453 family)
MSSWPAMISPSFNGFAAETFAWFDGLQADNSKRYFTTQRATYDAAVRGPLEAMLDELAEDERGIVKMFRQHRDVRFSSDKSPYKTTTYGVIGDRLRSAAPLYAQLSAAGLFAGTGYYRMDSSQLARFREAIVDDRFGPALERAVRESHAAGVQTFGERLKSAPRGYPRDHPRIRLLRHRLLIAGRRLEPAEAGISRAAALDHVRSVWKTASAINAWLDRHVGPGDATVA